MIRGYDTSSLHWKDEILRIRHLEAEIASIQKKIERQKLFSAGHQPAPGHVPLSPGLCLTCPAVCYT